MSNDISDCVKRTLNRYFRDLDGETPQPVYDMVIRCAEKPMLEVVMRQANGNQTMAADILGINRNTLRRKLADYDLL
jgi:Fis family transcriptional regulator